MNPNQQYGQNTDAYQYNQHGDSYGNGYNGNHHSPNVVLQTIKSAPRLRCTNSLIALVAALLGLVFVGTGLCVFFFIGHDNVAKWPAWALIVGGALMLLGGSVYFIYASYCRGTPPHTRMANNYEMGQQRQVHGVQPFQPAQQSAYGINPHGAAAPVAPTPQPSLNTISTDDIPPSYESTVGSVHSQPTANPVGVQPYGFHNTSV